MKYHKSNKQLNCQYCAMGKHKKKPVPKVSTSNATIKGERISLDITTVQGKSFGGAKLWLMIQDEFTDFIWSRFIPSKDKVTEEIIKLRKQVQKE
jgi:hypothetical protein